MSEYNIHIPGGSTKRLLTGGKYCLENILVTAEAQPVPVEKDVNFYDFEGTLLHSYTLEEAQALSELPPLPERETLTCLGWNWTLENIKALPVDSIGADIGALYLTADGKTHCYFEIMNAKDSTVTLYFTSAINIDWGDGTVENGVQAPATHTYSETGSYVAKLFSDSDYYLGDGSHALLSTGASLLRRLHLGSNTAPHTDGYGLYSLLNLETVTLGKKEIGKCGLMSCGNLNHINLGHMYAVGMQSLQNCYGLKTISFPYDTYINNQGLRGCYSLKRVIYGLDNGNQLEYAFYQNYALQQVCIAGTRLRANTLFQTSSLQRVNLKEGLTSIEEQAFQNSGIPVIKVPSTVTVIKAQAFQNCTKLKAITFLSAVPPTVENANAFTGIPAACMIEVPADSLQEYQEATNYGDIAAQMVGV